TLITSSRESTLGIDIPDRLVTGIAHIDEIAQIHVETKDLESQGDIFQTMADAAISVDFINIMPDYVMYTVPNDVAPIASKLLPDKCYQVETTKDCAKVSAVGAGMTGIPGVAARIVQSLTQAKVDILQAADSHTTIWVLVKGN